MTVSPQTPPFPTFQPLSPPWHLEGFCSLSGFSRHVGLKSVLFCLGYIIKYRKLGGLQNRNLLSHSLEAGNTRSRCQQGWCLMRVLSAWIVDNHLTWPFLGVCTEKDLPLPLLIRPPILWV